MKTRILLLLALALLANVLFVGCAENRSPIAPAASQHPPDAGGIVQSPMVIQNPMPLSAPLALKTVSKRIPARTGGCLTVGTVRVQIPARALGADTTITLSLTDLEQVRFRIEPVDLQLSRPARVTFDHLDRTTGRFKEKLSIAEDTDNGPLPILTQRQGDQVVAAAQGFGDYCLGAIDDSIETVRYLTGPGYTTVLVRALTGGTVTYDRYSVRIPALALSQDTYITVRDPGLGFVVCELEPHGIQFRIPVTLQMDLRGLNIQGRNDWTIYWYDESRDGWVDLHALFKGDKLLVGLPHFSKYEAGRAGW